MGRVVGVGAVVFVGEGVGMLEWWRWSGDGSVVVLVWWSGSVGMTVC